MRIVPWAEAGRHPDGAVLPVAVISLDDQLQRRRLLIERGIPADWLDPYWPATDLRSAHAGELAAFVDVEAYPHFSGEPLRAAVVGCAASHRQVAHWLAASALPLVLVLEDDVIPTTPEPAEAVREVAELLWPLAVRGDSFVCHLGTRPEQLRHSFCRPLQPSQQALRHRQLLWHIDPRPTIWRAHAYLLSRGAAMRAVARETTMASVADDWVRRRDLGLLDRLYLIHPRLFAQDELLTSTLGVPPQPTSMRRSPGVLRRALASLHFRTRIQVARVLHQRSFRLDLGSG